MKLAVAMAIIRSKPESLSGLQHAENLCRNYQVSSDQWRERAVKLEEEMITLKQQLVLAKLQTQQEATNSDGTAGTYKLNLLDPFRNVALTSLTKKSEINLKLLFSTVKHMIYIDFKIIANLVVVYCLSLPM